METDKWKTLVRSSETTFDRNARAFDVLQRLAKSYLLDSTPYLWLCLKLYLTIGVSIASNERSFSKLKMIKSYLRSTMNADRLSALSILSLERDYVQKLNFEEIIANFTLAKAREVQFFRRLLIFYLPHTFVHHFVFNFWPFLKQYRTSETRHIICNYYIKKIS